MPTKVSIPSNSFVFGTTPPSTTVGFNDNDTYVQTSDGTATGTYIAQWRYDVQVDTWVVIPTSVPSLTQVFAQTATPPEPVGYAALWVELMPSGNKRLWFNRG